MGSNEAKKGNDMLKYQGFRMFRGRNDQWMIAPERALGSIKLEDLAAFADYDEGAADAKRLMAETVATDGA